MVGWTLTVPSAAASLMAQLWVRSVSMVRQTFISHARLTICAPTHAVGRDAAVSNGRAVSAVGTP